MTEDIGEKRETPSRPGEGPLSADAYEAEDVFAGAEEWSPTETKLVVWSFIVAAIALAIGGILVNIFILK
jgi:hypothetical protein